jgi:hypothetical protein
MTDSQVFIDGKRYVLYGILATHAQTSVEEKRVRQFELERMFSVQDPDLSCYGTISANPGILVYLE